MVNSKIQSLTSILLGNTYILSQAGKLLLLKIYYFSLVILLSVFVSASNYEATVAQMLNQSDFTANPSDNATASGNESDFLFVPNNLTNSTAHEFDLSDLLYNSSCTTEFPSTSCRVAKELTGLKPKEIEVYGLSDYPRFVIQQTLMFLNAGNLTKVLLNLSPEELIKIRGDIGPRDFNHTLSLVPEPHQTEILNKTSGG